MAFIFQQYIENEQKIQTEVRLSNYDVIVSEAILNFYTPPIVISPAIESFESERMTITNLLKIRNELIFLSDSMGLIETDTILLYFTRMT